MRLPLASHPRVNLVRHLVARDLKARYKVSVLGFFWSLLRPIFIIAILTIVFGHMFRFPISYKDLHYSVFLICGMLPWAFFAECLGESTSCLVANTNLIRKVYLPRAVFPLSAVLSKLVNFLLALIVLLPFVFIFGGVKPAWPLLLFPIVLLTQTLFAMGLALILSIGNVYFRDLTILVEVITLGWFYVTPVFYPLYRVWGPLAKMPILQLVYMANPMASIIYAYRRVLLFSVPQAEGSPLPISDSQAIKFFLLALIISLILFILGAILFRRCERCVEDYL